MSDRRSDTTQIEHSVKKVTFQYMDLTFHRNKTSPLTWHPFFSFPGRRNSPQNVLKSRNQLFPSQLCVFIAVRDALWATQRFWEEFTQDPSSETPRPISGKSSTPLRLLPRPRFPVTPQMTGEDKASVTEKHQLNIVARISLVMRQNMKLCLLLMFRSLICPWNVYVRGF